MPHVTATPRPWRTTRKLSASENDKGWNLWGAPDANGDSVWVGELSPVIDNDRGDASAEGQANAVLVPRAVNSHDRLVRALDAATNLINTGGLVTREWSDWFDEACAALAEATAEEVRDAK